MNKSTTKVMALLATASLVVAACGGDSDSDSGGTDEPGDSTAEVDAGDDAVDDGSDDAAAADDTAADDTAADDGDAADDGAADDGETAGEPGTSSIIDVEECADPEAAGALIDGPIKVGWSAPESGPLANAVGSVLAGMEARFAVTNADGGVDGHMIELVSRDDAFDPERAKSNVAELIESDGVHVLDVFGSGQLNAVADDQNIACVPLLFAQASAPEYRNAEEYPWTTEYLPDAVVEAQLVVNLLTDLYPDGAEVALAVNPTASGVALSEAYREALGNTNLTIAEEADLTDPDAAATTLSLTEAPILINAGVTTDCLAITTAIGRVGWKPDTVIQPSNCADGTTLFAPAGEAADGQLIMKWLKEPGNPLYEGDEAIVAYEAAVADFGYENPDSYTVNGWVLGELMVDVFESAAASDIGLSRVGIMDSARTQSFEPSLFLDGVGFEMSPDASLGIVSFQPMMWSAADGYFVENGDVISLG